MASEAMRLETSRLAISIMGSRHRTAFARYRNDEETARHQSWDVPYSPEDAAFLVGQDEWNDYPSGRWVQLAVERQGLLVGDVAVRLDERREQAEIGYTLAREHWGHGYAREAALAVVGDLVERVGVVRIVGELDPANTASARVLEAIGLVHESDAPQSYHDGDRWSDSQVYAVLAIDWRAWRDRPMAPPASVDLIPIDADNQRRWRLVETHWTQRRFVSPVDVSYGDALFPMEFDGAPLVPVLLGLVADGEPAGFVMYADATPAHPTPFLWRFLIDRRHQGRGLGRRAMALLRERLRDQGHRQLLLSFAEGPGSPAGFYDALGARRTGRVVDGEIEAVLDL